jgi:tubulin polyglutamylase TTLL5
MDAESLSNRFAHLTNYSVNKHSASFVPNTDAAADDVGAKWSLRALRSRLRQDGIDVDAIWSRMNDIIIKTIISAEPFVAAAYRMFAPRRDCCFELFGFDILIDDTLRPWLMEVNLAPSLGCDAPIDVAIKGALIADLFTLVGYTVPGVRASVSRASGFSAAAGSSSSSGGGGIGGRTQEQLIAAEAADEMGRAGGFERIYPTVGTMRYDSFFDGPRGLNSAMHAECVPVAVLRFVAGCADTRTQAAADTVGADRGCGCARCSIGPCTRL